MSKTNRNVLADRRRTGNVLNVFCFDTAEDQLLFKDVQKLDLLTLLWRTAAANVIKLNPMD